ncbi:MAG: hypothetical protein LUG16_07660 [Candidatus Gastranaerophilales bacterium]|nr:hypothetical protein [Candidatus Gastranaerophilales bacterium]
MTGIIPKTTSFKRYVPISYYAKNPNDDNYTRIVKNQNIRKCQRFVVSNLNSTAKNNKNEEFINYYRKHDPDYRRVPAVRSVYDENKPVVYLVTGSDVDRVDLMGKEIGKAKRESIDKLGHSKSFEARSAVSNYFNGVKDFLKNSCTRLKSANNENLSLKVYFEPKYNKKNELVKFNYMGAEFTEDEI